MEFIKYSLYNGYLTNIIINIMWNKLPPKPENQLTFSKTVFVTNGKKIGFGYYNHAINQWRTFSLDGDVVAWHDLIYPPVPEKGEI